MSTTNVRPRVLAAALASLALMTPLAAAQTELTDAKIAAAVTGELLADPGVDGYRLDVSVEDGIVTLDGTATDLLSKERAARVARLVKGVRSIVDEIDLDVAARTDADIERDVDAALAHNPATESWELEAKVDDQVVTLSGTVDSWAEKELAKTVAKGVRGVREVADRMRFTPEEDRGDAEIAAEIHERLRWDKLIDDALIEVEVDDGAVELSGIVGSAAERDRAFRRAWVGGVHDVSTEDLTVEVWTRDDRLRENKYVSVEDDDVEKAVERALEYDARVDAATIDVAVEDGRATLTGTVDNLKAKRAAESGARWTVGVWDVENFIRVQPSTPTDETIEARIEERFAQSSRVERHEIAVTVEDGEVYLYGDVDSSYEKAVADDLAARVYGVVEVSNHLRVRDELDAFSYDPYVDAQWYGYDYDWYAMPERKARADDWEILEEVRDELFWSPFVESHEVMVSVDDGVVTLTGTVDTLEERRAATENALEGGAAVVDNDLVVRYGPGNLES